MTPIAHSTKEEVLRKHLIESLGGQNAHLSFENTIKDFPEEYYNTKVKGVEYSCWDLLYHMQIAQSDILDFIKNPDYRELAWPADYWPVRDAVSSIWNDTIQLFLKDKGELVHMLEDYSIDLFAPIPNAPEYPIIREMTIVANHNSYHTGQILTIRKMLGIWPMK